MPKVLLPYQAKFLSNPAKVRISKKSRRVGMSWALAGDCALDAARSQGCNTTYISYDKNMTLQFISDAAEWAKVYNLLASEVEETVFEDEDDDILAYVLRFASGHNITALSSKPRNIRSRKGRVCLDEFAFHDDPEGLLKAAIALLMWGKSKIDIISSVGEEDDFFEKLCNEVAPDRGYYVQTTTLDDALTDGLYQRICLVNGEVWTPKKERQWREKLIKEYGTDAMAELFCKPTSRTSDPLLNYFDESKHVKSIELDPKLPLHVSFDFNRHPATCVLANNVGDTIVFSEEFYLLHSDTFKLSKAVCDRISEINPPRIFVGGDATGKAKTANSQQSNWDIVSAEFKRQGLMFVRQWGESNPPVVDTLNSANHLFLHDRCFIHPRCKELIRDIQKAEDDGKGGIDKKKDLMRQHLIDGFRYICYKLYPVKSKSRRGAIAAAPLKSL